MRAVHDRLENDVRRGCLSEDCLSKVSHAVPPDRVAIEYSTGAIMHTPEEAWALIEPHLRPLPAESRPRLDALGRVLAADLAGTVDMPPADVSAMDGYALAGPAEPGATWPVVATAAAGSPLSRRLETGETAKIMTGAVVPEGADRVLPIEQTDGGTERVLLREPPVEGAHIRRRGEVSRTGDPLLYQGTHLGPGGLSLLASHGYAEVPVHRAPRVALITTGDELVPPEAEPGPGQLRDSNTTFMLSAVRTLGLDARPLGTARDDRAHLEEAIRRGLEDDVLLLSGGVSMGDFDYVEDVLADLGCTLLFEKLAIQPGKPLVVARHDGGWIFGLPGNPASVMVTFWLFVRPVLRRLLGFEDHFWRGALQATLTAPIPSNKARDRFVHCLVEPGTDGNLLATPRLPQGSHDVLAYGRGSALLRREPLAAAAEAGETCSILPLGSWPLP